MEVVLQTQVDPSRELELNIEIHRFLAHGECCSRIHLEFRLLYRKF